MIEQPSPGRRAVLLLADLVMLLLGLVGTVFCLVTAFSLPCDAPAVLGAALACAALAVLLFRPDRRRIRFPLVLLALILLAVLAWRSWDRLYVAAMVAARQVTGAFAEALSVGGPFDITPYVGHTSPIRERQAVTDLLRLLAALLALWLGWIVVRARSFALCFLGVFPFLLVPLSVTITPGWTPLVLVMCFWGLGLLGRLTWRKDPWGTAKQTLLLLPPVLALLLAVGAAFPRADFQRDDWTGRARLQLTDLFTRTTRGGVTAESGLGLALGGSADVDLGSAGPLDFNGRTVLRVESDTTGHIYLRGFSAATYTGDGWKQLSEARYEEMREGLGGVGAFQPINFPAMADTNVPAVRMVVENVGAPDRFVYTPYQLVTTPERMSGAEFVGDAYLARGTGVWKHILYVRDRAAPAHEGVLAGEAAEAELHYRAFVREHYLQIPDDMKDIIGHLVRDAELEPLEPDMGWDESVYGVAPGAFSEYEARYLRSDTPVLLGELVADYLAGVARYDPGTPAPRPGEDFVARFVGSGRGYCMHFASTATLMLRALGVPARYVSGYVADVTAGQRADVPDYNAHAWVEVYCEGYGWQPVEVTPGFDGVFPWEQQGAAQPAPTPVPTVRPQASAAPTPRPSQEAQGQQGGPEEEAGTADPRWLLIPAALLALCAAFILRRRLAQSSRERRFGGADANQAVIALYGYCVRVLAYARGGALDEEMEALGQKARFSQHVMTEEERGRARAYAHALAQRTDHDLKWYKKLAFRYLFGLY